MSIGELEQERERLGLRADGRPISERALEVVGGTDGDVEVADDPQDGLFDQILEDPSLEAALERRQKAKDALKPRKKDYDEAHAAVRGMVVGLELGDPEPGDEPVVVRCGRFKIKRAGRAGNSVSFETSPSVRTTISMLKD